MSKAGRLDRKSGRSVFGRRPHQTGPGKRWRPRNGLVRVFGIVKMSRSPVSLPELSGVRTREASDGVAHLDGFVVAESAHGRIRGVLKEISRQFQT